MTVAGKLRRSAIAGFAAVGMLLFLVTFTPFVSWYAMRLAGPWYEPQGDVLVVLSAAGPNLGVIDPSTYWRCTYAIAMYKRHAFDWIIVSGKDIAPGMRDLMVFSGVPAEKIVVENLSETTHESAVQTAGILAKLPGRKVLLTSDGHMFRAYRAFLKQGLDITPVPIPDTIKAASSYSARWSLFIGEMKETLGIVYYRYKGWI
jgi:uncharacterized SAM-binding protein YcdF (DUF218 family)